MKSESRWLFALALGVSALGCSKKDKNAENTVQRAALAGASDAGTDGGATDGGATDAGAEDVDAAVKALPVKLIGPITLDQVTHKLFQPGEAGVPHPFYKAECAKGPKPQKYPTASGKGNYTYDAPTKTLKFSITYSGLSGPPIMAHFHKGSIGKAGPIVQSICGHPPPGSKALGHSSPPVGPATCPETNSGTLKGSYTLGGNPDLTPPLSTAEEERLLLGGALYVNIHTCLNEVGEIRGQVIPVNAH